MRTFLERNTKITTLLEAFPCVAIIGPRQCGKSTLAKHILSTYKESIYLDLERPSDRNKLTNDPELFLKRHRNTLICLDEIQNVPELFEILRSEIDDRNSPGQFLILGSASPSLLKQTSETLAGRIAYEELTPFTLEETKKDSLHKLWVRGGYPSCFLAKTEEISVLWRENYIKTFLERDIPQFGFQISSKLLERFWTMLAHSNGQILNSSKLGASLGLNHKTIRHYIDILEQTFIVRVLNPYEANIKKRLVKSPKIYIRDTGLLHTLLNIQTEEELFGNPIFGSSWEGFAIEQIINKFKGYTPYFARTEKGTEIDLILEKGTTKIGIECKASTAPKIETKSKKLVEELKLDHLWVAAPIESSYPISSKITASPINLISP